MKLLETQDYLLLIDEEVICKTGELYLTSIQKRIIPKSKGVIQAGDKIIAYYPLTKEAKELDLPLLPPFEVNIEELACKKYDIKLGINDYDERYYNSHNVAKAEAFIAGYKAAQPKQFSLEDMKKALSEAFKAQQEGYNITAEEIIQSLSTQQLPKEFIPIDYYVCANCMEDKNNPKYEGCHGNYGNVRLFKTTKNSEGKQEIQGEYIW